MHELAICQALMEQVREIAGRENAPQAAAQRARRALGATATPKVQFTGRHLHGHG